jgi:hypothetical protein
MKKYVFVAALIACAAMLANAASAQSGPQKIAPSSHLNATAVERTPEQMDAFAATYAPPQAKATHFHPTVNETEYRQMKEAARAAATQSRPTGASAQGPQAPPVFGTQFAGPNECDTGSGCWIPPDSNGTIGSTQFVSTDNDIFAVYSKAGLLLKEVSLNAFFGYGAQPMFDPRVQYDETWKRFIVTADAFPQSSTSQILGIAISKTSSATGGWWIYFVDIGFLGGTNGFYDFPMLGESQDAVIFTANVFTATSFQGSSEFSVAKARLYNGLHINVPVFTGLIATMQPSHQVTADQNGYSWMVAAPSNNSNLYLVAISYPASPQDTGLFGYYAVPVTAYTVPAGATQPGCGGGTNALDTSDNRFVNAGTQNGDLLYQAHSVYALATGRYYIINGLSSFNPALQESGDFFSTGDSSDFNVSIAADSSNRMVLNWSSVSPSAYNARVRFTGKLPTDGVISGAVGSTLYSSPACLTGNYDPNFGEQRWGDYSQVSVDPSTAKAFWIINETIPSTSDWGTRVGKVHF